MKFVIYDDETLQPITFVNLRGIGFEDIERLGRRLRMAVPPQVNIFTRPPEPIPTKEEIKVVDLFFEPLCRNTMRHGMQETWICFTEAVELAALLKPDWMLGQQAAVEFLQTQNDRLTDMLMASVRR